MRKITTGKTGSTVLGTLLVDRNSFQPLNSADTLTLKGSTVEVEDDFDVVGGSSVRFYNGTNYAAVNAPSLSSNTNFTLPGDNGTAGYTLHTDGSGNLSWSDSSLNVNNQTADNSTYYPLMSTASSGTIADLATTTGKLEFQPSSGTLTVSNLTVSSDLEAGTITETSSMVLKTDIEPIENALDSVVALSGVSYTRIATGRRESGLIAEEVEKIIPEIVNETGDYKSISYSRLTAYLIEAVKDLRQKLNRVENG